MPTFSQRHVLLLSSYIIIFGGLLLVLPLKLLPSLLAGLLVYELVNMLTPQLQRLIEGRRARWRSARPEWPHAQDDAQEGGVRRLLPTLNRSNGCGSQRSICARMMRFCLFG